MFKADVEALVNPVNTMGIMGKGLALEFKKRYTANFNSYQAACQRGSVRVGKMHVTFTNVPSFKMIFNFPTKEHWKEPSELNWITEGLVDLRRILVAQKICSVAIPALGAGLGGLAWESVRKEISVALEDLDIDVYVYLPQTNNNSLGV